MQPNAVMQYKMSVLNSNVCKLYIYVCVCNIYRENPYKVSKYTEPNLMGL